jgi:SagB-type dehydrogenase family enzyme
MTDVITEGVTATVASPESVGLLKALEELSEQERRLVLEMVRRARRDGQPIDRVSIFHESLKADLSNALAENWEEISSMKAPPVVKEYPDRPAVTLPREFLPLDFSLQQVLQARASRRDYTRVPVSLQKLSTLLHYAYGIRKHTLVYNTRDFPVRFAPTAGGLQSVELYLVSNQVESLTRGLYHYNPARHGLELLNQGNMRRKVVESCLYQDFIHYASFVIVLTCMMDRLQWKYGARAYRYVHMDAGFVGQNLYLVTTALKLRLCAVAGFIDDTVNELLEIDGQREFATLLLAVGSRPGDEG